MNFQEKAIEEYEGNHPETEDHLKNTWFHLLRQACLFLATNLEAFEREVAPVQIILPYHMPCPPDWSARNSNAASSKHSGQFPMH